MEMNYIIAVVFSLLLAIKVKISLASASWDAGSITVKQGENVNVTCIVSDFDFMDVIQVSLKNSEGQVLTLAENTDLKLPFVNIPRYRVGLHMQNRHGHLTVFYSDIRGEDMGTLLCHKRANGDVPVEMKLHVQVPVKEIYLRQKKFYQWKRLQELETVVLREMESNELECVAVMDGGLTLTELSIAIGNEDKTQFFTASEESKIHKDQDSDLGVYYSDFKLLYSSMNPVREFNGLTITCTAVQDGFQNASTSALLRVEYSPIILCDKYEHHSKVGGLVVIACEIDANPSSQLVTWVMQPFDKSEPIRLDLANVSSIQTSEKVLDGYRKQVKLTIERVEQFHFSSYHLSAMNDISTAEVTIILLPASMELSQIPSAQDQMMYFLQQQQMSETKMAQTSGGSWILENLVILNTFVLILVILLLS